MKCPKCGNKLLVHPPTGQSACSNPKCCFAHGFPDPPQTSKNKQETWTQARPYVKLGIATLILLTNIHQGRGADSSTSFYFEEASIFLDEFEKQQGWREDDSKTEPTKAEPY